MHRIPSLLSRAALFAISAVFLQTASAADRYPARPVKVIVPFPAGGSTDTPTRLILEQVSKTLGQPFIVQNQPGAGGRIGVASAAKAKPDGYTLVVVNHANMTIPLAFGQPLEYDPLQDIAPISPFTTIPIALMVNPKLPVRSASEFIEYARNHPGKVDIATAGLGTMSHLGGELLKLQTKIDVQFVHYKGDSASTADVIGGHVPALMIGGGSSFHRDGALRALAVTSSSRISSLPDVPTFDEAGIPNVRALAWNGLAAPHGTPEPVLQALADAVEAALADPALRKRLQEGGYEPYSVPRQDFQRNVREEVQAFRRLQQASNLTLE